MYSKQQANGFKTFVVTLSVSLLLFGALYYLITDFSNEVDIEDTTNSGDSIVAYNPTKVKGGTTLSVFDEISRKPVTTQPAVVLAGADDVDDEVDESTEAVVPDTGSETLFGVIMSAVFFSATIYVFIIGPRKFALAGFEEDITAETTNKS